MRNITKKDFTKEFSGREGDFLELKDFSIFEVKGLIHPPKKLISYPRYIVDNKGDRLKGHRKYRKIYPLQERQELLIKKYPHLLVNDPVLNIRAPEISQTEIIAHYKPDEILEKIRKKKQSDNEILKAIELTYLLEIHSGISSSAIGISGSIMIGLHTNSSDIDLIIYGQNESCKMRDSLRILLKEKKQVRSLNNNEMLRLYKFRGSDAVMQFEVFVKHEMRKTFQGMFNGKEFFIRYLPNWYELDEKYGSIKYVPVGYVKVKARVKDASEAFYSPCKYVLDQVEILEGNKAPNIIEAVSFRGRFCEQAETGELVIIQGKLEKVLSSDREYHRILLGGDPLDFMISLSL